mmetsp:Transcript_6830/g.9383  ORF Transcript_6830/g.9383 Transcript_6830/m.9383 type:complete len:696 (+) Transcript_6830:13623-15710(+)
MKYFFYTEYNKLAEQLPEHAFGPLTTSGTDDEFRITNLHKPKIPTESLRAFAITKSIIAGQYNSSDGDLINLILKPFEQPEFSYGTIRYIIYKGIKKDSLVDSSPESLIVNTTDLGKQLIAEQQLANNKKAEAAIAAGGTAPPPEDATHKALGLHLTTSAPPQLGSFADIDPIDNLFYRDSPDYNYTTAKGGLYIGDFDETSFGIELIIDNIGYQAPLSILRAHEVKISVPKLTGSPSDTQLIQHRIQKEKVLFFGDVCTFFGSYFKKYKFVAQTMNGSTLESEKIKGDDVYDLILRGDQHTQPPSGDSGTFHNRNRIMLDIRNEYNYSYNLFNNYEDTIQVSLDEGDTYSSYNYYTHDWPYFYFELGDFPTGNTSNKNHIHLRLAKKRVGEAYGVTNPKPLAYISQGYIKRFAERKGDKKFVEIFKKEHPFDYSDTIELVVPNYDNNGATRSIASHILVRYLKLHPESNRSIDGTDLTALDSFDHVFIPQNMKVLYNTNDKLQSRLYEDEFFIDQLSKNGLAYIAARGVAQSVNNVTFYAYATERYKKRLGKNKNYSMVGMSTNQAEQFAQYMRQKHPMTKYGELVITATNETVKRLTAVPKLGARQLLKNNVDELVILSIFKPHFDGIIAQINAHGFEPGFNVYFGLTYDPATYMDTSTSITYYKYDLVVRGFKIVSGELKVETLDVNFKVYA